MISANQIKAGTTIVYNNEPHKVMTAQHIKPGKGGAFIQTKLRNLISGIQLEHRFRSEEKMERAILDEFEMQYLYKSDDEYYFMNSETFEQVMLSEKALGDNVFYLKENVVFTVEFFNGDPVGINPPKVLEFEVVETEPYLKDANKTGSNKPAILDTGLKITIPPFIEVGEKIKVDTTTNSYIERAK